MHEATSVLFGQDGFRVIDVERVDDDLVRVVVDRQPARRLSRLRAGQQPGQAAPAGADQGPAGRYSRVDPWVAQAPVLVANSATGRDLG